MTNLRRLAGPFLFVAVASCAAGQTTNAEPRVAVGSTPAFELADRDGTPTTLAQFRGQVVVVDFWASWCVPCREAMPFYDQLQKELGADLVVLGINVDEEPGAMATALKERPVDFKVLVDMAGEVVSAFGVEGMPSSFLIDRQGRVVAVHRGFVASDKPKLRHEIESLLSKN